MLALVLLALITPWTTLRPVWQQEPVLLRVTADTPLQDVLRELGSVREQPAGDLIVELGAGVYPLERTLVFGPEHAGDDQRSVTWRAARGASVVISGARRIEDWHVEEDGTWSVAAPEEQTGPVRQLFVAGTRRPRSRWPREGWLRVDEPGPDGRTSFAFTPGDLSPWDDLGGAELLFLHDWSASRVRPAGIDEDAHRLRVAQPIGGYLPFFHITGFEDHPRYALENLRAGWVSPGQWHFDLETRRLHYRPLPGEHPTRTAAFVPVTRQLLRIQGSAERPVRRLTFAGITFAHTLALDPVGGYAGIQAAFHDQRAEPEGPRELAPEAAVQVSHAVTVTFAACRFEKLGASALWLREGTRSVRVARSLFSDVGANGLMIGEASESPGPEALTTHVLCEDSTFERCGAVYPGAVGIWIGIARGVTLRHNELRELPYSGISLGWIWDPRPSPSRGHRIERNHIHHVMQLLSDGGGIYTLGSQPDTLVRNNLIHDVPVNLGRAGSNGFFIDQGSNGMVFEGNIIHGIARSPIRFHLAGANTLANNRLVTAEGVPAYRFDACSAETMTFSHNQVADAEGWSAPSAVELGVGPR